MFPEKERSVIFSLHPFHISRDNMKMSLNFPVQGEYKDYSINFLHPSVCQPKGESRYRLTFMGLGVGNSKTNHVLNKP